MRKLCFVAWITMLAVAAFLPSMANAAEQPTCPKGWVYLSEFRSCVPDYGAKWDYSQFAAYCKKNPPPPSCDPDR